MKITNNQIQYVKPQKLETKNNANTPVSAGLAVDSQDSTSIAKSASLNKINTLQQEHRQTQQLFGSLTQLAEAIELFGQQPSAYEQNIKAILEKSQKDFPQLSKHADSLNVKDMMVDIDKIRQELTQKLSSEKKAIAFYLITEQNKDAVQKKSINQQEVSNIVKDITSANAEQVHSSRVEQISKLLS